MSEKMEDGGPAFPEVRIEQRGDPAYVQPTRVYFRGMSLRDYFAAHALRSLILNNGEESAENVAINVQRAYQYADAMLKEKAKR